MADIKELQKNLKYEFKDIAVLKTALTHPSYLNEKKLNRIRSNQRLEFFGDSVLSIIVSEYIFTNLRSLPEGKLTELRAKVVCESALAEMAKSLDVGSYLFLGRGEIKVGGDKRSSTLSDAMEAIIAAIYIDGGFAAAKKFVLDNLSDKINQFVSSGGYMDNFKTELQELVQSQGKSATYELLGETGPEHAKRFEAAVFIDGEKIADGVGSSKKRAEQNAAENALKLIK